MTKRQIVATTWYQWQKCILTIRKLWWQKESYVYIEYIETTVLIILYKTTIIYNTVKHYDTVLCMLFGTTRKRAHKQARF